MILKNLRREVHHEENRENNHVCRCIYLCDRSVCTRFRRSDLQQSAFNYHDWHYHSTCRIWLNLLGRLHFRHKKIAPIYDLAIRCDL
nr:MAG TPA: hypothetical protein [Caudoviricetes sp.]